MRSFDLMRFPFGGKYTFCEDIKTNFICKHKLMTAIWELLWYRSVRRAPLVRPGRQFQLGWVGTWLPNGELMDFIINLVLIGVGVLPLSTQIGIGAR